MSKAKPVEAWAIYSERHYLLFVSPKVTGAEDVWAYYCRDLFGNFNLDWIDELKRRGNYAQEVTITPADGKDDGS